MTPRDPRRRRSSSPRRSVLDGLPDAISRRVLDRVTLESATYRLSNTLASVNQGDLRLVEKQTLNAALAGLDPFGDAGESELSIGIPGTLLPGTSATKYRNAQSAVATLAHRAVIFPRTDGYDVIPWLAEAQYRPKTGTDRVHLTINEQLRAEVVGLTASYVVLPLKVTFELPNVAAIRLFEVLQARWMRGLHRVLVFDRRFLQFIMGWYTPPPVGGPKGTQQHARWDSMRRGLRVALDSLEEHAGMQVELDAEAVRQGRQIDTVIFTIKAATATPLATSDPPPPLPRTTIGDTLLTRLNLIGYRGDPAALIDEHGTSTVHQALSEVESQYRSGQVRNPAGLLVTRLNAAGEIISASPATPPRAASTPADEPSDIDYQAETAALIRTLELDADEAYQRTIRFARAHAFFGKNVLDDRWVGSEHVFAVVQHQALQAEKDRRDREP